MNTEDEKKYKYTFSTSKFNLLMDCYGKYFYTYIQKLDIKEIVWPATIFGLALHKTVQDCIEEYNRSKNTKLIFKNILPDLFTKNFNDILAESKKTKEFKISKDYDKKEFEDYGEKWSKITFEFINKRIIEKEAKEILSEQKYSYLFPELNLKINGVIDFHYKDCNDKLHIIDFKTTKDSAKYFFVEWKKDIQSLLYFYLINQNFNIDPESFSYMILNKNEKVLFTNFIDYSNNKDIFNNNRISNLLEKIFRKYIDILDTEIQNESKWLSEKTKCQWCSFKQKCPVTIK